MPLCVRLSLHVSRLCGLAPYAACAGQQGALQSLQPVRAWRLYSTAILSAASAIQIYLVLSIEEHSSMEVVMSGIAIKAITGVRVAVVLWCTCWRLHWLHMELLVALESARGAACSLLLAVAVLLCTQAVNLAVVMVLEWRSPTTWVIRVLANVPSNVAVVLFAYLLHCLGGHLRELNGALEALLRAPHTHTREEVAKRISDLRRRHRRATQVAEKLTWAFGPILLVMGVNDFCVSVSSVFQYTTGTGPFSVNSCAYWHLIAFLVSRLIHFSYTVFVAELATAQARKPVRIILHAFNNGLIPKEGIKESRIFLDIVDQLPLRMSILGIADINAKLLAQVLVAAVTYLVIMLQFQFS